MSSTATTEAAPRAAVQIPSSLRVSDHPAPPIPSRVDRDLDDDERSAFVPVALLGLALLAWLGFQCWQLASERGQLQQAHGAQAQLVRNAIQFRARLDTVARETQLLADKGNRNARLLVDELGKRGITINPNAASAAPPGSAPAPAK